jgi:hypothetical protein
MKLSGRWKGRNELRPYDGRGAVRGRGQIRAARSSSKGGDLLPNSGPRRVGV